MATTVLQRYQQDVKQLQQYMAQNRITADILWRYGELSYRISVLETCQVYCKSAPVTTNTQALTRHYQMFDAYIQNLAQERSYGPMRGPDTEKERNAARVNLGRVIDDYRKRFTSFAPAFNEAYGQEIGKVVGAIMPVWLQMRETFVPLRVEKQEGAH